MALSKQALMELYRRRAKHYDLSANLSPARIPGAGVSKEGGRGAQAAPG
jgi:hypothetical protein